jgi:hypothetical protein
MNDNDYRLLTGGAAPAKKTRKPRTKKAAVLNAPAPIFTPNTAAASAAGKKRGKLVKGTPEAFEQGARLHKAQDKLYTTGRVNGRGATFLQGSVHSKAKYHSVADAKRAFGGITDPKTKKVTGSSVMVRKTTKLTIVPKTDKQFANDMRNSALLSSAWEEAFENGLSGRDAQADVAATMKARGKASRRGE